MTGIAPYVAGLPAKQMELAREVVPGTSKVGGLANLEDPKAPPQWQELEAAGHELGVKVVSTDARTPDEVDAAFEGSVRQQIDVLIVLRTSMLLTERRRIANLAATTRTPAIYHVDDGGLIIYGVDLHECFRRSAYFVDKILNGVPPSDLPDLLHQLLAPSLESIELLLAEWRVRHFGTPIELGSTGCPARAHSIVTTATTRATLPIRAVA